MRGPRVRAVIFDLEEALLDRRRAWQYAIEESVAAVCGERVTAEPLVGEYRFRPWSHALSILVVDRHLQVRCEETCAVMYERSAMKRLLVHDGIGVALDHIRARRVEMGAISREQHRVAIRQIESTGLDRFLTVLAPTPPGETWRPADRIAECLGFLGRESGDAVYVGCDVRDLEEASRAGIRAACASYSGCDADGFRALESPGRLVELLTGLQGV